MGRLQESVGQQIHYIGYESATEKCGLIKEIVVQGREIEMTFDWIYDRKLSFRNWAFVGFDQKMSFKLAGIKEVGIQQNILLLWFSPSIKEQIYVLPKGREVLYLPPLPAR